MNIKIKQCLISVYNKKNLDILAKNLKNYNINIIASSGTKNYLDEINISSTSVDNFTNFPSVLDGRVKTLHPKIYSNILSRRTKNDGIEILNQFNTLDEIDLVIIDLYPFEEMVLSDASSEEIIENIDVGGVTMLRAAAKNYKNVVVLSDISHYELLIDELENNNGYITEEFRKNMAFECFAKTSLYDEEISGWFMSNKLRYGENPHQKAQFIGNLGKFFHKIQGKELSYNNLLDIDAAFKLISEFSEPTIAIFKHTNPCGVASGNESDSLKYIWNEAFKGDPLSAFGGIIISNREIDLESAKLITEIYFEILIAPKYSSEALNLFRNAIKKILLRSTNGVIRGKCRKSILDGILKQNQDNIVGGENEYKVVTEKIPSDSNISDLIFANKIVKHTKSNSIVIVKDKKLIASGMGQASRIDALNQAVDKAKKFNKSLEGSVMASDAFFPFDDCVTRAAEEGITSIIQPGGSIRDKLSIKSCNNNNISMIFTGTRHFKH